MPKSVADPELLKMLVDQELTHHPPAEERPADDRTLSKSSLALLIGGNAADAGSTIYALGKGAREANPLMGDKPSAGKVLAIKGAGTAAQYLLMKLLAKDHPKLANAMAKISGGAMAGVAVHNLRQGRK